MWPLPKFLRRRHATGSRRRMKQWDAAVTQFLSLQFFLFFNSRGFIYSGNSRDLRHGGGLQVSQSLVSCIYRFISSLHRSSWIGWKDGDRRPNERRRSMTTFLSNESTWRRVFVSTGRVLTGFEQKQIRLVVYFPCFPLDKVFSPPSTPTPTSTSYFYFSSALSIERKMCVWLFCFHFSAACLSAIPLDRL